ncbi:hypothetical protein HBH69_141170 [Parastagonospora nodorum]|nr:hypothetical protein HBI79_071800 [Parastagonospora nodorum]KAH5152436.1 hypothetical protein HBH69_141170 [Parastagonospora nodorum]KAH5686709.1 hypothetical protein HBI23_045040 [Parastagonospora nodorum]KAH6217789.1 hypothetical protein HBI53_089420 [Parastagonospora nodorum]
MVWGLGNGSGSGKGKGPVDKRSANPSPISNNKGKEPVTPSTGKGARKRPAESASPPPRRSTASVTVQLQPLEEIFLCYVCLKARTTSSPAKNPRQGRGTRPNYQCMDCGHMMCDETCVVQKAQDPIGAWIFGLAAKNRLSVLPWESDRKGSGRIATFGTWSLSAGLAYSVVNAGTTTTLPLTRKQKNSAKDSKWLMRLRKRSAGHHRTISRTNQISRHLTRTRPHRRIYHRFEQTHPSSQRFSLYRHTWCHLKRPRQQLNRSDRGLGSAHAVGS